MGGIRRFARGVVLCLSALLLAVGATWAQDAGSSPASSETRLGGPQDWSNRHVIYTRNGSLEDMLKVKDDPRFLSGTLLRYMREQLSRNPAMTGLNGSENNSPDAPKLELLAPWDLHNPGLFRYHKNKNTKVDWSVSLGATAGTAVGESPSVYTANYASPNCTNDFVVYTINATPSTTVAQGQANLIGLNNLYSSGDGTGFCSGTGPSFLFSYAIGSGPSPLSPVLSLDGTKVAWIENQGGNHAFLHVTNWLANQGATATAPVAVNGTWSNGVCTTAGTSCDFSLDYTNGTYPGCSTAYVAGNGHSDLYVDYGSNSGFISADNGLLYHIANIFSTTKSPTVDFCVPVNASFETSLTAAMSAAPYDFLLNEVFITDSEKIYAYTVNASAVPPNFAPANTPYTYGNAGSNYTYLTGPGPVLDAFNNFIYVFSTYDAVGGTSVTQLPTNATWTAGSGHVVSLGPQTSNTVGNRFLFYGAFDNNYFTNGPKGVPGTPSTLYSCGTDSTTTNAQDLFSISFNSGTGFVNATPAMSNNQYVSGNPPAVKQGLCSPLTEFYDGTHDRLFVGLGQPGSNSGSNLVTMWTIDSQLTNTSGTGGTMPKFTAIANGYPGGASGMSADNNANATAQAENVYFSTEQVGGTATQVPATTAYNVNGIYRDGSRFPQTGGLDDDGNAYSSKQLGTSVTWNGTTYNLGPANSPDAWQAITITLPTGQYSTLSFLAAAVNGNLPAQTFVVNYTDGTNTTLTQSVSDWFTPQNYPGESVAATTPYRNVYDGSKDNRTFLLYGYSLAINPNKKVASFTLPPAATGHDHVVVVLAVALSGNCGGADYCAVKLTQTGLQ